MTMGVEMTERSRRAKATSKRMVRGVAGFNNMVVEGRQSAQPD